MHKYILVLSLLILLASCAQRKEPSGSEIAETDLKGWHLKDLTDDSIPGISLHKAYNELLQNKKSEEVIVAVIDTEMDIQHEDLKNKIWKNKDEIPNNDIDDDQNGYVDDIQGWNFITNKKGDSELFVNYEYTRILKKYNNSFFSKIYSEIPNDQKDIYKLYLKAYKKYQEQMKYAFERKTYIDKHIEDYDYVRDVFKMEFPRGKQEKSKVDSLKNIFKSDDSKKRGFEYLDRLIKYDITKEWIDQYARKAYERLEKLLNLEYNDRKLVGDDLENLADIVYGSPIVNKNIDFLEHATLMAGVIAATRDNNIGIDGIVENVKIMPLSISSMGDEQDKDMALAIRYAADNGAKIINISTGKEFSLHPQWILDAIKWAEQKDVLIVNSSGNNALNLDDPYIDDYPDDVDLNKQEVTDNFIKVGGTSYSFDKNLAYKYSDYGRSNVDIMAPAVKIYTTTSSQQGNYRFSSGTSDACAITSGVAALIRSYYPDLKASEVKEIILRSGTTVNKDVEIEKSKNNTITIPFSELSKTGKIVNAYSALKMAKSFNK
ncbi:S8 family peptidase [Aquimarina litoralis]|uniref:S8 family peptidase n=1 Tax=Aquimarina litoralis TaxID=584605 RepID=A0ABP3TRM9_9FLAO